MTLSWSERQVADPPLAPRRPAAEQPAGTVVVEPCAGVELEQHVDAWADLASRAVEPNVFCHPGFALAAMLHLPSTERPEALLCWDGGSPGASSLIGLLLFHSGRALLSPRFTEAWTHPLWVTGAPLLDRTRAAVAFDAMLGWLSSRSDLRAGLLLRGVMRGGPLHRVVEDGGRRQVAVLDERARAVLDHAGDPASVGPSAKRAKEMRRQARRLGDPEFRSASSPGEVVSATERFLVLEAQGWKGRKGTALLSDGHAATFTRVMTRMLARRELCRIDELTLDGSPVAMGIVLRSGDRSFFWKTAYDEGRARFSPGKLLAHAIALRNAADPTLALSDSCAVPDHPMIDRVWPGRATVVDCLVAGPAGSRRTFARAVWSLRLARSLRDRLKRAYHVGLRLRGRGAPPHGATAPGSALAV